MGVICYKVRNSGKNNMEAAKPIANPSLQKINLKIKNSNNINTIQPRFSLPSQEDILEQKDSNDLYPAKIIYNYFSKETKGSNSNIIKMKICIGENDANKYTKILYNIGQNNFEGCNINELNESNTELYVNNKKYKYKSYFLPEKKGIYDIELNIKILIKNCCCLFYYIYNLQSIDLSSFNTQNVTDMSYMFDNCYKLGSIVINRKASNITNLINKGKIIYA